MKNIVHFSSGKLERFIRKNNKRTGGHGLSGSMFA
jgi:hypothetical protein